MPNMQINCPNCRQPIVADIEQVYDLAADPSAKNKLLSGTANMVSCPHCGYQGSAANQILYHDPEKELLLTFTPQEMGLSRDEQEKRLGALMNRVINNLPQDQRKGYLLQPQTAFTYESFIEKILEADGITKEMIDEQQKRVNLIQRMLGITDEGVLAEVAKQEDELIDAQFFTMMRTIAESASGGGDQEGAQQIAELQNRLLPITTFGREMQAQNQEIEAAMKDLQDAGDALTREKLLELIIDAPNETRLGVLVSLTRPGLDYEFFQLLAERIDRARGEGRTRLVKLRDQLLEMTSEIDKQIKAREAQVRDLIGEIVGAEDVNEAMLRALPAVDEFFVAELNRLVETSSDQGDTEQLDKYMQMVEVIQQVSQAHPEMQLIEDLLAIPNDEHQDASWRTIMDAHREKITPEFLSALSNIATQAQSGDDQELAQRLIALNRQALRYSMQKNLA
jgi:hypothetical protein